MGNNHECVYPDRIQRIDDTARAAHTELYVGSNGRPSITVRMDRVEMVSRNMTYVGTCLVVAAIIGGVTFLFKTAHSPDPDKASRTQTAAVKSFGTDASNN